MSSTTQPDVKLPLDKTWLEKTINEKFGTNSKITSYNCAVIGDQKGFLSTATKADLTWSPEAKILPRSIVIKAPTDEKLRQLPEFDDYFKDDSICRLHNAEVDAYTYFNLYQPPPIPMPRYIYGRKYSGDTPGLIITEFSEGRSLTLNEDHSVPQLKAVIRQVAALHAYCLNHGREEEFAGALAAEMVDPIIQFLDMNVEKMRKAYPDEFKVSDSKVDKIKDKLVKQTKLVRNPDDLPYRAVVCLGDLQPNNTLWKVNEKDEITNEINVMLDFQLAHRGSCVFDLCCALFWTCTAADRVEYQDHLLELYQESLKEKSGGKTILCLVDLKKACHEMIIIFATQYLGFVTAMIDTPDVFGITQERLSQFVEKIMSVLDEIDD